MSTLKQNIVLDKISVYGVRVQIERISAVDWRVYMLDSESSKEIRSKTASSERMAMLYAERMLS